MLLLLLASEGTVHYSCWDSFTMDGTRYSSKQDTNTSLNGKQMQTSTQLRGSRDISPSMLDLRGIKSLENKVKPRVVTHAHHMAAKCNIIHHQVGLCAQEVISFFLIALTPEDSVHWDTLSLLTRFLETFWFPFLRKKIYLPYIILFCFEPILSIPFPGLSYSSQRF